MNWKEEFALSFRKLTIDKDIIIRGIKKFIEDLQDNFNDVGIKIDISSDFKSYVNIGNYKRVTFNFYTENTDNVNIKFSVSGIQDEAMYILSKSVIIGIVGGKYLINFNFEDENSESYEKRVYFIDETIIDEIFKFLLTQ